MRLRYTPPLSLPRVSAPDLVNVKSAAVAVETQDPYRRLIRHAPAFIDDPAATGLFAGLGREQYAAPAAYVSALPNGMVLGYRTLVWDDRFCGDEALSDPGAEQQYLQKLASADHFPNEDTGLRATPDNKVFELAPEHPRRHIDETVVVLCSHEPSNFGSFLFRVLPKLHAVKQHALDGLPLVVWAHTPSFVGLLGLAGVAEGRIIQHDTHSLTSFRQVFAPSLRNPSAFLDQQSHSLFQQIAADVPGRSTGRKLYISRLGQARRNASTRRMSNEGAVVEMVQRLGFEVLEPETMSPAEQVAAFASAAIIVGPAGSALFNVAFCRPGTKIVDIESEPHWIYAHAGLFASCKTEYGLFVGKVDESDPAPVHRRFSVDVAALEARITQFARS